MRLSVLADNPYQSPNGDNTSDVASPPSKALATWAIWLSLIFGISPVGGDLLFSASRAENPLVYIGLATFFLVLMATPFVVLFLRGGTRAFAATPIRITISCLIIALYVYVHGSMLIRRF